MTSWGARSRRRRLIRFVLLAVVCVACILPVLWTVLASLGARPDNTSSPPVWNVHLTLENYVEIGTAEEGFWGELAVSIATSAVSTLLTIAVSFLAAYSLVHSRMRGRRRLLQSFLILASMPVMAYAIPLDATVRALGLHDTFIGVVLAQAAMFAPLGVYVMFGYLLQVSTEVEEAAGLDGASPWRTLFRVVLPIDAPGAVATSIIIFVLSWNSFLLPMVLTTHHVRTIPIAMSDFFTFDRELEWPTAAAALVVSLLPLTALVAGASRFLQRFFLGELH